MFAGIDYGSKLAGTTAIAFLNAGTLKVLQSEKKKDADLFIHYFVTNHQEINTIYIDAPLSLPNGLVTSKGSNYHYRTCDKELKAMSPMFLGGLTARAIQLKDTLRSEVSLVEVYPGGLVRVNPELKTNYEKKKLDKIPSFMNVLQKQLPVTIDMEIKNWHQVDAVLAWWIGWKHQKGRHQSFGDVDEGLIYI